MQQDLYALAPDRTEATSDRFRSAWLRHFEESAEEYEVPRNSDHPDSVYTSVDDLIRMLAASPAEGHAVYWHNSQPGPILNGMLFFTTDGGLVVGLSIADEDADAARQILSQLAATVGAAHGYATFEEPPPATTPEFLARARSAPVHIG